MCGACHWRSRHQTQHRKDAARVGGKIVAVTSEEYLRYGIDMLCSAQGSERAPRAGKETRSWLGLV